MKGKMKAIVKKKAEAGAVLMEVDIPKINADEVLIEVQATSICGTDVHMYNWDNWAANRVKPPFIMGHEVAGRIVKVGERVDGWVLGDYVSVECHDVCGRCYQCLTGQAHLCQDYRILGVDCDGVFADYVKAPAINLWKNRGSLSPEIACLQDPVGNAVHTTLAQDIIGKTVVVMGCGPIGLFAVGIAAAAGAEKIYAIDVNEYRLNIAEKMGAHIAVNARCDDVVELVMEDTCREGADVLLEMSGSEVGLGNGLNMMKNGGNVALLSLYPNRVSLNLSDDVVFKGLTIRGITGRKMWDTWYKTSALLSSGQLNASHVITHKFPMERFEEGFEAMNSGESGKIILYP